MRYRTVILLALLSLSLGCFETAAQTVSESRVLEKSFAVTSGMSLDVTNKYGKIHLSPSKTDSVLIRIELNASASKSSRLRKLVDGVSFDLNSTNHFIIAETKFSNGPINLLEGVRNITNNLISSDSKLQVDYYISAPQYIDVKIDNRYGDIYIESTEADLGIRIINGDLKAEDLWGVTSFELSFCDASISSLRKSRVDISYGNLEIERAEIINLKSTSSKIEIKQVEKLVTNSKRDKFFIKGVTSIEGDSYFTEYNIDLLREKLNMTTRYGSINIELIPRSFNLISIESSYTSVYLNADQMATFEFDAKLSNCYSTIPESWIIEEKVLSSERSEYLYFGDIGSGKPSGQVILKLTRGKLVFDQNSK